MLFATSAAPPSGFFTLTLPLASGHRQGNRIMPCHSRDFFVTPWRPNLQSHPVPTVLSVATGEGENKRKHGTWSIKWLFFLPVKQPMRN